VPIVDLPLDELSAYKPPLTRTKNFAKFWKENASRASEQPLNARTTDVRYFTDRVNAARIEFDGFEDRSPIVGYFIKAPKSQGRAPTMVAYHGYNGNKGRITDYLGWVLLGFNVFAVDVRGQTGESADHARYRAGAFAGHMTKGILDENSYYYRYVYMDCYRAVDYVLARDEVDGDRVGVTGTSQGGGLSIAIAGLHERVALTISNLPFLCNFERSMNVATSGPYLEIMNYLRARPDDAKRVLETLSYFDSVNIAPDVTAPSFVSVGLVDEVCPPSSVYAAFNHLGASDKRLEVYPGIGHEETNIDVERKLMWASSQIAK
jgi:cephalosporin-C deacetylase